MAKIKATIVAKRDFDFTGKDGKQVTGKIYGAIRPDGRGFEFSSQKEHAVIDALEYNETLATELELQSRISDEKLKFKEL